MQMHPLRRTAPALVLALVLPLSACGGGDDTDAKDSPSKKPTVEIPWEDAKPATGIELRGTGYSFKVPEQWENSTQAAKASEKSIEVAASGVPDATGVPPMVNVIATAQEAPDEDDLDEFSKSIEKELKSLAPELRVNKPTKLDGENAIDHEGAAVSDGIRYYLRQLIVFKGDRSYTITFTFSRKASGKQRNAIIEPVLASWTWQ